jgi:hypothetical protein
MVSSQYVTSEVTRVGCLWRGWVGLGGMDVCFPLLVRPKRFALAPVAIIIESAVSGSASSWCSRQFLNDLRGRPIFDIVSVIIRLINRRDWARNLSINSGPSTPLRRRGFRISTGRVVRGCSVSCGAGANDDHF